MVEVQLVSGDVCEGVLRAISPSMEISLNVAHIKGQVGGGIVYHVTNVHSLTHAHARTHAHAHTQPPTTDSVYNRKEISFAEVVTISAKTGTNPQLGGSAMYIYYSNVYMQCECMMHVCMYVYHTHAFQPQCEL